MYIKVVAFSVLENTQAYSYPCDPRIHPTKSLQSFLIERRCRRGGSRLRLLIHTTCRSGLSTVLDSLLILPNPQVLHPPIRSPHLFAPASQKAVLDRALPTRTLAPASQHQSRECNAWAVLCGFPCALSGWRAEHLPDSHTVPKRAPAGNRNSRHTLWVLGSIQRATLAIIQRTMKKDEKSRLELL